MALLTLFPYYYVSLEFRNPRITGYVLFFLYSLGFYFLMFNGMRQFLAMSILLLGYANLAKGSTRRFFFFVVCACFIHLSSLCAILMYFVSKIRLTTKRVVYSLLASFVFGAFANAAFFEAIAGKYIANVDGYGLRSGLLYIFTVGLLTNMFFFWLYNCNLSLRNNLWVKYNLFSIVILNIMANLVIGPRIVYIYSISSVVALSLYASQTSENKLVRPVIYLYSIVMFIRFLVPEVITMGFEGSLIPYDMNFQIFDDK